MIRNDPPPLPPNPMDGLGMDDAKMKGVTDKLADIKRREIAADSSISGQLSGLSSKMMPKLEEMSRTAGVEAEKMKPWDAEHEAAKRQTDPIEAFGSLGSVFGILASAFTHAPMENAMNASAAAINAIKAGNAEDYNRAYKAWEANTKQALERHQIEHAAFEDAVTLMKTNMEVGMNQLRLNAARFGNQKDLALLEAGMNKELFEYHAAQEKLATELQTNAPKVAEANAEMAVLLTNGYNPKNPADPKNAEALKSLKSYKQQMDELAKDPTLAGEEGKLVREFATTPGPDGKLPDTQARADFIRKLRTTKQKTPAELYMDQFIEEHPHATAAEMKEAMTGMPGAKGQRQPKPEEEAVRARAKELTDADSTMSKAAAIEQAQHEYKVKTAAPTGNKMDDIKSRENKISVIETNIDHLDDMLLKHKAITGIGGKITRAGEAVGNILGASPTDRAQFRRWVLEIQETLPSVLNDRNGRPISSEAEKIEGIVAGLAAGDTNANTLRAYDELRPLMKTLKAQLRERRGAEPDSTTTATETTKAPARWEDAPIVSH